MTRTKVEELVLVNKELIDSMLLHATAASGLITAAQQEYIKTGTLPVGALVYVLRSIDQIALDLAVLTNSIEQENIPF